MSRGIMSYHKSTCSSIKVWLIHSDSDKTCPFYVAENQKYAFEKHKRWLYFFIWKLSESIHIMILEGKKHFLKNTYTVSLFKRLT